jgi:hypothetical protein
MANIADISGLDIEKRITVDVVNLNYTPNTQLVENTFQFLKKILFTSLYRNIHYYRHAVCSKIWIITY